MFLVFQKCLVQSPTRRSRQGKSPQPTCPVLQGEPWTERGQESSLRPPVPPAVSLRENSSEPQHTSSNYWRWLWGESAGIYSGSTEKSKSDLMHCAIQTIYRIFYNINNISYFQIRRAVGSELRLVPAGKLGSGLHRCHPPHLLLCLLHQGPNLRGSQTLSICKWELLLGIRDHHNTNYRCPVEPGVKYFQGFNFLFWGIFFFQKPKKAINIFVVVGLTFEVKNPSRCFNFLFLSQLEWDP